jgi:hypothetical protein
MTRITRPASVSPALAIRAFAAGAVFLCAAQAGYKDDIGWTKLAAELGSALPEGTGVGVSHIEAPESPGNFGPNTAAADFAGKTFTLKSGAAGTSSHATLVAGYYYGIVGSVAPGVADIDIYEANNWIGLGFLKTGTTSAPASETRTVQNHSWVAVSSGAAVDILRRLDYAIQQDDFLAVVGLNNGSPGTVPALLASAYNGISVGLSNGGHSHGTTTVDGSGRTKPEIVAPESFTSFSTPMVSATAALLHQAAPPAGKSAVVLKSILLAGATKSQFPAWSRTTTRPIDSVFGAGQVNAYRGYRILEQGEQNPGAVTPRGWDVQSTTTGGRLYFFDIAAGNTAPAFSAVLAWNRVIADGNSNPNAWSAPTSSLTNLNLRLHTATGFTIGTLVDSSESAVDNIEHIYQPALPPGRYALEVTSPTNGVQYGLAWYSQPTISIAATNPAAAEQNLTNGVFTLTRSGEISAPLTATYTVSGSATEGSDFLPIARTLTFPAGVATAGVAIGPLADAVAEGPETVILTISPDIAYSLGSNASAVVGISDLPADAWRFSKFTSEERADPALSGDGADFDKDGIPNLLEYALALEPKIPEAASLPAAMLLPGGELAFTYTRAKAATDLIFTPEVANNVGVWNSGPGITETVSTLDNGLTETVTVKSLVSPGTDGRQFMRLRVARP